jgi:hypothetical protein
MLWFAPLESEWEKTFALPRGCSFWLWKVLLRWGWNYCIRKPPDRSRLAIVELAYPLPAICKINVCSVKHLRALTKMGSLQSTHREQT